MDVRSLVPDIFFTDFVMVTSFGCATFEQRMYFLQFIGDCRLGVLCDTSAPPWGAQASRKRVPKKDFPPDVFLGPFWSPSAALGECLDDLGVQNGDLLGVPLGVHMQTSKLRSRVDGSSVFTVLRGPRIHSFWCLFWTPFRTCAFSTLGRLGVPL